MKRLQTEQNEGTKQLIETMSANHSKKSDGRVNLDAIEEAERKHEIILQQKIEELK